MATQVGRDPALHAADRANLRIVMEYKCVPRRFYPGEFQNEGECNFFINDFQVYTFPFYAMEWGLGRLRETLRKLSDLPVRVNGRKDCEALLGRLIWWREVPAVIENFDGERGLLLIRADNEEKLFPHYPWTEAEYRDDRERDHRIMVDLFDPSIHWFRSEDSE